MRMLLTAGLAMSVLSCSTTQTNNPLVPPSVAAVVVPDSSGNIVAHAGDSILIEITNGSADGGYWWNVVDDFDSALARLVSFETQDAGVKGVVGGPVNEIWTYRATKGGTGSLRMELYRSWEPNSIVSTRIFTLAVQ
jgi:predicted secreted protein